MLCVQGRCRIVGDIQIVCDAEHAYELAAQGGRIPARFPIYLRQDLADRVACYHDADEVLRPERLASKVERALATP